MVSSYSDYVRYVILLKPKVEKKLTENIIRKHVEYLKKLDEQGVLILCGPFKEGKGGMLIVNSKSFQEAKSIAEADPFVKNNFETYELRTWELSCKENNHLGMG